MLREELDFERPAALQATQPPEVRGLQRDEVRLMVSTPEGHTHTIFQRLADHLRPSDLLVVNCSATLAASLPAFAASGPFRLNFATSYGGGLWLAEPRWSHAEPGPLPLTAGETVVVADTLARLVAPYPGLPRLWFVHLETDAHRLFARRGEPIRYGYVTDRVPLAAYQTIFAGTAGSAEMPSAGRPFSRRVLASLYARGVRIAGITLHTGLSSMEVETAQLEDHPMVAEPFHVPVATAAAINAARAAGQRVIAVGTTVVRALESVWDGVQVQAAQGFTRIFIHPGRGVQAADGLISGFHDPLASHLAMLYAIAGRSRIADAYAEAVRCGYLWHEFGDSHLIWA